MVYYLVLVKASAIIKCNVYIYQAELDRVGYKHKLEFEPKEAQKKRQRNKNIIYFNPPWSITCKTKVGKKFLSLLDKHFPKGSPLHPLINRKKVKLSYRCLPNMGAKLSQHNKKLLRDPPPQMGCNCRNKATCPMPGKCTTDKLIYRATVTTNNSVEKYVGLTANRFKDRYAGHKQSAYIWKLKRQNKPYQIKFDVVTRAAPFSPVSGTCNLCNAEKYQIDFHPDQATLNSRNELFNSCRHKKSKLLVKVKKKRRRGS